MFRILISTIAFASSGVSLAWGQSVESQPEYLVGAYYFAGWWREQPNKWTTAGRDWRADWPGRVPLLGEYNDQESMDREIVAAAEHNVDFFQILWYPQPDKTRPDPQVEHLNSAVRLFMDSPHCRRMKFTIEFVNHPPFDLASDAAWVAACREWCKAMTHPSYLRIDGRPVFKVHGMQLFHHQMGKNIERIKFRLETFRQIIREAGLENPLFSAGTVPAAEARFGTVAEPYDFLTTYMDMPNVLKTDKPYPYEMLLAHAEKAWKTSPDQGNKMYVPYVPAGWDPRPWRDPRPPFEMPTRERWTDALRKVKTALDADPRLGVPTKAGGRQKMLLIYAWNEFGEGGFIAPTRGEGTMKLECIREVFGASTRTPSSRARDESRLNHEQQLIATNTDR